MRTGARRASIRPVRIPATAVLAVLLAAAPAAAAGPRQVGSLKYTATAPGTPTGLVLDFEFHNPEDPDLKPHALASLVVRRPPGGLLDTTVPPQCKASNAELMVQGPSACPPDTQIGTALAVSDTGGRDPFPRYSRTFITQFNNQDEIVAVGENDTLPFRPVDRTRIEADKTTTNFPAIPGAPPPDPFTPFKTLHFEHPPYVRDGRAYNRTPPTCPDTGYWTMVLEFIYRDGVTETVESRSPCERTPARPRLALDVRPGTATSRALVRYSASVTSGGRPVKGATVKIGLARGTTNSRGIARVATRLYRAGARRAVAVKSGFVPALGTVAVTRRQP